VPPLPPSPVLQRRQSFGVVIRARRTELGLSQEQLADRAGCGRQTIVRVETATHAPSLDRVFTLADALDTSVGDLFQQLDRLSRP
jgi:XRE family transcriptional regulator, regulator of sulfur utilization